MVNQLVINRLSESKKLCIFISSSFETVVIRDFERRRIPRIVIQETTIHNFKFEIQDRSVWFYESQFTIVNVIKCEDRISKVPKVGKLKTSDYFGGRGKPIRKKPVF